MCKSSLYNYFNDEIVHQLDCLDMRRLKISESLGAPVIAFALLYFLQRCFDFIQVSFEVRNISNKTKKSRRVMTLARIPFLIISACELGSSLTVCYFYTSTPAMSKLGTVVAKTSSLPIQ